MNKFILSKVQRIQKLNPDKIYVENIRSLLSMPLFIAKVICEMAVKENLFEKKIGLTCPNCHNVLKSYNNQSDIGSEVISCINCEHEEREYDFAAATLNKLIYYKLIK